MKNEKMFISFLLFMLFTHTQVKAVCSPKGQDIPVYKKVSHLGTRTKEPSIKVNLVQGQLYVNVSQWYGAVKVNVYDANSNLLISSTEVIEGSGSCVLDLTELDKGSNYVFVELGDIIYWGILDI